MQQYSSKGTPVEIALLSGHLLFIDPLYLDDIREECGLSKPSVREENYREFLQALEVEFFPYGGGALLGYLNTRQQQGTFALDINGIKDFDSSNPAKEQAASTKQITAFALDSGSLLVMDLSNFSMLLSALNFDDLVNASEGDFQLYQEKINAVLGNKGWAYIESPGIGSGFDLIGSGSYYLVS